VIAHRLAETLLFLETSSHTAADREYLETIRRMIAEHAAMREALEHIYDLTDSAYIRTLAKSTLEQSHFKRDQAAEASARQIMEIFSEALPSEEQMEALQQAVEMIHSSKRGIF